MKTPPGAASCVVLSAVSGFIATTISVRVAAGDVAVLADADGVPGGQALDVGGEQVLAAHRDAHLEHRAQQGVVGGLAAGAVLGGDDDREVVDDRIALRLRPAPDLAGVMGA